MSGSDPPRELHGLHLIGYSMGFFGIFLTNILISVFAFQFYVYTINMDAILTSVGISINLIIAAISSIIFGVMSDNKKPGRFGKRRPFLLYGLPIWFLTSILIWLPPWKCPTDNSFFTPTVIYFWVILCINSISGASILSSHAAMLAEQSQTHRNREKVASLGTILSIIASILAMLLPLIVQSILPDPQNVEWWLPSGEILLLYMPIIGLGFGIFGVFSVFLTFITIDESFHNKDSMVDREKSSILDTFRKMALPARDKNYRKYLTIQFSTYAAGKTLGILVIPFLTYVLLFQANEFFIYIIVSISCKFGWFYLSQKLRTKKDFMKSFSIFMLIGIIVSSLELLFLIGIMAFPIKIVLFIIIIGTLLGVVYVFGFFALPLSTALIYEAASKYDESNRDLALSKISGSYSGLNSFAISIGQAFASLLMGFILVGSNKENPTIITIGIASMAIFYVISLIFIKRIELNQLD
jgi:Na+/melibiose symporter-like transporter